MATIWIVHLNDRTIESEGTGFSYFPHMLSYTENISFPMTQPLSLHKLPLSCFVFLWRTGHRRETFARKRNRPCQYYPSIMKLEWYIKPLKDKEMKTTIKRIRWLKGRRTCLLFLPTTGVITVLIDPFIKLSPLYCPLCPVTIVWADNRHWILSVVVTYSDEKQFITSRLWAVFNSACWTGRWYERGTDADKKRRCPTSSHHTPLL